MALIRYRNSRGDISAQPVYQIHDKPEQLPESDLSDSAIVESIPGKPEAEAGKKPVLLYNPATGDLWWEQVAPAEATQIPPIAKAGTGTRQATVVRDPFVPDRIDGILALAAFVLGFLFIRWVFFAWQGVGVALFTLLFMGTVLLYLRRKGLHPTRSSWFWMAILLLTGLSYALWSGDSLHPWRDFFLFGVAVYWVLTATNMTLLGRTSDWLPLDGLQALLVIPWRNFGSQYQSLFALRQSRRSGNRTLLAIGLGLLLALVIVSAVLPLLLEADSGGFSQITAGLRQFLRQTFFPNAELMVHGLLTIPTAAYLFALIAGSAHKRGLSGFDPGRAGQAIGSLRVIPAATSYVVLGAVSVLYLLFIGSQLPYFFSAFAGQRPEGWLLYSEYARRGFFELVRIAGINLTLLAVANLSSKQTRQQSVVLRIFNCMLALLTLLLIATAFSKMALYIGAYGLSMRRLLPCLFMALLAIICGGIVVMQWRQFSIMRLAAGVGAVMFCAVFLANPDGFVTRYNANRYLAGTLDSFDVEILYRAGPAGVDAATAVQAQTNDQELHSALADYLLVQRYQTAGVAGTLRDTLQHAQARRQLEGQIMP